MMRIPVSLQYADGETVLYKSVLHEITDWNQMPTDVSGIEIREEYQQ